MSTTTTERLLLLPSQSCFTAHHFVNTFDQWTLCKTWVIGTAYQIIAVAMAKIINNRDCEQ